jgi:hypothetical protein
MKLVDDECSLWVLDTVVDTHAVCLVLTLPVDVNESIRAVTSLLALQRKHVVLVALVSASELRDVTARLVHVACFTLDRTELLRAPFNWHVLVLACVRVRRDGGTQTFAISSHIATARVVITRVEVGCRIHRRVTGLEDIRC